MRTIRIIIYFISIAILSVCTSIIANQFSLNPLYRKWLPWVIGVIVLIILILIEIKGKRTSEATPKMRIQGPARIPSKILRVLSGLRGKNVKINDVIVEKEAERMEVINDIKAKGDIVVNKLTIKTGTDGNEPDLFEN